MISYITTYRHNDKKCILLYDLHVDLKGAHLSKKQLNDIITTNKKMLFPVITEDMFDYAGNDATIAAQLPIMQANLDMGVPLFPGTDLIQYSPLCGFVQRCKTEGIPVINTEFRQNYMLNVHYATRGMIAEAVLIFEKLIKDFQEKCAEITQYNDTPILNSYYQKTVDRVTPSIALLSAKARTELTPDDRQAFLAAFWDCMLSIIDAIMIHTWFEQSQQHDTVVLYVGGEHALTLENLIAQSGYTQVAEQGDKSVIEYSKHYRMRSQELQLQPVVGLLGFVTIGKNLLTSWKLQQLKSTCIKKYRTALTDAKTIDIASFFTAK